MWKQSIVLCAFMAVALGALSVARLEPKPDKFKDVEGCYLSDLDAVIPFGTSAPSKTSCMEYWCSTDFVKYVSCSPRMKVPASLLCKVVADEGKPFPECCPKTKC